MKRDKDPFSESGVLFFPTIYSRVLLPNYTGFESFLARQIFPQKSLVAEEEEWMPAKKCSPLIFCFPIFQATFSKKNSQYLFSHSERARRKKVAAGSNRETERGPCLQMKLKRVLMAYVTLCPVGLKWSGWGHVYTLDSREPISLSFLCSRPYCNRATTSNVFGGTNRQFLIKSSTALIFEIFSLGSL